MGGIVDLKPTPTPATMSDSDDWNPRGTKKGKKSKKSAVTPKKAQKDPNAPKRPMSAYMMFVKTNRSRIVEENPGLKPPQVLSKAGEEWKELTSEDKVQYDAMNAKDKKRYAKEMEGYVPPKGMTAGGKRKKEKDPNAPKRPSTPYFAFMNEHRAEIKKDNPSATIGEIGKLGGRMWGELEDEAKQKYTEEYQAKMEDWREEMAAYQGTQGKATNAKKAKKTTNDEVPTSSDSD